ncbi:hypothetical protein, partial [Catenulispora rubra]|uniref:hypothetical protein n=1 Tax=Catenulispora rubra TaxID=280293 RepID=UPI001E455676
CWLMRGALVLVLVCCRGAVGVWFTGDFYGFANGWMASQRTQFGCAPQVALAAAGVRVQDRASVRVTAHAFGLAGGGRVWWVR